MKTNQLIIKRYFDIVVAFVVLLLVWPIMVCVAICVRATMGKPVIFSQRRPGLHGKLFTLYKFRTMTQACDGQGNLLSDKDRLTLLGRFLRRTSLDELPEFFNVLKGEMSLVGPRPLVVEYLERYTQEQKRRHLVRPGITGLAQISGRQSIPFSQRLSLDVFYVDNFSLWMDVKILLLTLPRVIMSEGVIPGQEVDEVDDLKLSADLQRTSQNND